MKVAQRLAYAVLERLCGLVDRLHEQQGLEPLQRPTFDSDSLEQYALEVNSRRFSPGCEVCKNPCDEENQRWN